MRHRLALLFTMLVVVLLASLGPLGPAGADDDDDDDEETAYPLTSFPPSDSDNVVLQWNNEALECIRAVRTPPVVNARALFIVHSAAYDAWAAYDAKAGHPTRQHPSPPVLGADDRQQEPGHQPRRLPGRLLGVAGLPGQYWDAQLAALGSRAAPADATTAATVGRTAADAVIAHRSNDNSNQANSYADTSGYQPVNPQAPAPVVDPWRWQPQTGAPASTPHWRQVTPFSPNTIPNTQVPNPPRSVSQTADNLLRRAPASTTARRAWPCTGPTGPGRRPRPATGT